MADDNDNSKADSNDTDSNNKINNEAKSINPSSSTRSNNNNNNNNNIDHESQSNFHVNSDLPIQLKNTNSRMDVDIKPHSSTLIVERANRSEKFPFSNVNAGINNYPSSSLLFEQVNELEMEVQLQFQAFRSLAHLSGHNNNSGNTSGMMSLNILLNNLDHVVQRKREELQNHSHLNPNNGNGNGDDSDISPQDFCAVHVEELDERPLDLLIERSQKRPLQPPPAHENLYNKSGKISRRKPRIPPQKRSRLPTFPLQVPNPNQNLLSIKQEPPSENTQRPSGSRNPRSVLDFGMGSRNSNGSNNDTDNENLTISIHLFDCDRPDLNPSSISSFPFLDWHQTLQVLEKTRLMSPGQNQHQNQSHRQMSPFKEIGFFTIAEIHQKLLQMSSNSNSTLNPTSNSSGISLQSTLKIRLNIWNSNILTPALVNLFALHGPSIEHLLVGQRKDAHFAAYIPIPGPMLVNLLVTYTPNLKTLEISSGIDAGCGGELNFKDCGNPNSNPNSDEIEFRPISMDSNPHSNNQNLNNAPSNSNSPAPLPFLKTFRIFDPHGHPEYWSSVLIGAPLIHRILNSAPSLDKIYGLPLKCCKILLEKRKSHTLRSILHGLEKPENSPGHFESSWKSLEELSRWPTLSLEKYQLTNFFSPQDMDILEAYQKSSASPESRSRWKKIHEAILNSSHSSLKKLEIVGPLDFLDFIVFPRMGKLEKLKLTVLTIKSFIGFEVWEGRIFPPGFDFQGTFPQLRKITLSLRDKKARNLSKCLQKIFPHDLDDHNQSQGQGQNPNQNSGAGTGAMNLNLNLNVPTGITHLKLKTDEICVRKLALGIFPHIQILTIALCSWNIEKILPKIFESWPKLKELRIELGIEWDIPPQNLDAAFTGIPRDKCTLLELALSTAVPMSGTEEGNARLHEKEDELRLAMEPQIEGLRVRPSIVNMEDLQLLKIIFKVEAQVPAGSSHGQQNWLEKPGQFPPLLSRVSKLYAFASKPQLEVQVSFHKISLFPGLIQVIKDFLVKPVESSIKFVE